MPETPVTPARPEGAPASSEHPLAGRTALVTGGGGGIGRAVAARLAAQGAQVTVLDRDKDNAHRAAEEIGGRALVADLSDPGALDDLDAQGLQADILVNNAGFQHVAAIQDFDPAQFALVHRVLLEAPFRLTRALIPGMYERGWGRIVHITSVHGHRASPFKAAYVSAKHGLEGLSKVIAMEAAGTGVTSNTVAPGYVRTALVENQIASQAAAHGITEDEVLERVMLARTPLKRLVEPDEVAGTVAYLCGPGTDSVTGSSFLLDGGWTAG
jgi:3-hydroxybutyrate dehydrogenase